MRRLVVSVLLVSLLAVPAGAGAADKLELRLPDTSALIIPEGIDVDERTGTYFTGSTTDGTIYRGALTAPVAEVYQPAGQDGRTATQGFELDDERQLLFVATAQQGNVDVIDITNGKLVGRYTTGMGGYINDIGVTPSGDVYFTDSFRPILYRVRAADVRSNATPEPIPILPPFTYSVTTDNGAEPNAAFNAGGIDALDDDTILITQINEGRLFRYEVATNQFIEVPIANGPVDNLDALELQGQSRAYTTDNLGEEIITLELTAGATSARVLQRTSEPATCTPTGIGLVEPGQRIVVTNAQLFRPTGSPFTISSLPLPLDGTVDDNPDRGRTLTPCARDFAATPAPAAPDAGPEVAASLPDANRAAPRLQVSRAFLRRGRLHVRATLTRKARGEVVGLAVRAAGHTTNLTARVARRGGALHLDRRLRRRPSSGRLRISYPGDGSVRPFATTLRVAPHAARLRVTRPTLAGGRLRATGRVLARARGSVQVQIAFRSGGRTRTFTATAPVRRGRFRANRVLPGALRDQLRAAGPVQASVRFAGDRRKRVAGALRSFAIRPR